MPVWRTVPVSKQNMLTLVSWSIRETETGERHFVGFCIEGQEGRVSSSIERFDVDTREGITRTGRSYHLLGAPGRNDDAEYVWNIWVEAMHVTDWREVTAQALNENAPPRLPAGSTDTRTAD